MISNFYKGHLHLGGVFVVHLWSKIIFKINAVYSPEHLLRAPTMA